MTERNREIEKKNDRPPSDVRFRRPGRPPRAPEFQVGIGWAIGTGWIRAEGNGDVIGLGVMGFGRHE